MTHPIVQPDPEKAAWLVYILNGYLIKDGWQFAQKGDIGGRPIFEIQQIAGNTVPLIDPATPRKPVPAEQITAVSADHSEAAPPPSRPISQSTPLVPNRTKVFISYSHNDIKWFNRLRVHLAQLEREGKLDRWDDTRIRTSQLWQDEIRRAIDATKVAVLLVSADFLASDFIAKNELPPLLAAAKNHGAFIMPVIVSACRFSETPTLSIFQAVNPPSSPIIRMRHHNREAVWHKLTNDIADALSGKL